MTVSKHRCTGCKCYFDADSMIKVTAGNFHSEKCKFDYAMKKTDKLIKTVKVFRKKTNARQKREYYDNNKSHQLTKAIVTCNKYIVLRDGPVCISCGTTKPTTRYSAGHYKTAGAYPELRFHPDNIHSQCWFNCNKNRSGNIVEYRPRLLEKIGADRLAYLEGPQQSQGYTIDDYKDINDWYGTKIKQMQVNQ